MGITVEGWAVNVRAAATNPPYIGGQHSGPRLQWERVDGRIFGDYRLRGRLGAGAQAEVWLAEPRAMPGSAVVLKIAAPGREAPDFKSRFLHEAKLAQAVDHPNVVRIVDAGQVDARLYLAMEHIEGLSFSQVVRAMIERDRLIPAGAAIQMAVDALRGLHVLQAAVGPDGVPIGFVHRDIAPKNLMLDRTGVAKVIDLGIARSRLRGTRTATGVLIGTPGYMSPEQVRADRVDGRSDVFSMGAVLFELLTLDPLIHGTGLVEVLVANSSNAYRPPTAQRADLDPRLDAIVRRALMVDPADRYATARAFVEALDAVRPASARDDVRRLVATLEPHEPAKAHPPVDVHAPTRSLPLDASTPTGPLVHTESGSVPRPEVSGGAAPRPEASGGAPRPAAPAKPVASARPHRSERRRWGAKHAAVGVALGVVGAWSADRFLRPVPLESVTVPAIAPVVSERPSDGPSAVGQTPVRAAPTAVSAGSTPDATNTSDPPPTAGRTSPTRSRRPSTSVPSNRNVKTARQNASAASSAIPANSANPAIPALPANDIQALIAQARRLAERAPDPASKSEALGVVIRLNRLSAEVQRGRTVDLRNVRAALKGLEARLPR